MTDTPKGVAGDVSRDDTSSSRDVVTKADKLRALADWLDAHPGADFHQIQMYSAADGEVHHFGSRDGAEMAQFVRSIGGRWEKEGSQTSDVFTLRREILPGIHFEVIAMRHRVCERVVVGTREVEVPDPHAPKVMTTEEVVEWRCGPLLDREVRP